jgi:hypothetical protein
MFHFFPTPSVSLPDETKPVLVHPFLIQATRSDAQLSPVDIQSVISSDEPQSITAGPSTMTSGNVSDESFFVHFCVKHFGCKKQEKV